jgi:hypothetical protein
MVGGESWRIGMASSMRRRKGDRGRLLVMRRRRVCGERTRWAWRCGHALHAGGMVLGTGWDDE